MTTKRKQKSAKKDKKVKVTKKPDLKVITKTNYEKKEYIKWGIYAFYVVFAMVFISYHLYYANRVIPGVIFQGQSLSGKTTEEVVSIVREYMPEEKSVIVHIEDGYTTTIEPEYINFRYLPIETTKSIANTGRSRSPIKNINTQISAFFKPVEVKTSYDFDEDIASEYVSSIKNEAVSSVREPSFVYIDEKLEIAPGNEGYTFNIESAVDSIVSQMSSLEPDEIHIQLTEVTPVFSVKELDIVYDDMNEKLNTPFVLFYKEDKWELTPEDIVDMVTFKKEGDTIALVSHRPAIQNKLFDVEEALNKNPRGQVLEVEDGKAIQFVASQDGVKLKIKESTEVIEDALKANSADIELAVQVTTAPETNNEFAVKDLLGTGKSRFKGSAAGRIHNIGLAASRVSGTLVPPGEEFSFNEAVGEINKSTGYTSAWVISKGRTVLGDGGGVCQVSTTMFRAALDAGLPITERNAHSYRVSYYEQESPVGIDATIYRPSVDFRFKNDTEAYLLITAEYDEENYSLNFRIYGKDDGRTVEMTESEVLSRSAPPATSYVDDSSLPKGTTKQVEYSVWGASVVFGRTVLRDGEILYDDTFKSNYRAWGAIYNVGTRE